MRVLATTPGVAAAVQHGPAWLWYSARQAFLWLAVPAALYVLLASDLPAVHNATHELRHTLLNLVCH